jgi:hypothetical protein
METELIPESERPFQGLLNFLQGYVWREYVEKVIKVMADQGGKIVLEYPVQCLCEEVEDVWCGSASEAKYDVVVEFLLPSEPEQMPVCGADGDVPESRLEVKLDEARAATG